MAYSTQFQSLFNDVVTITNRPDLIAETEYALRRAIAKEHNVDNYPSDLVLASNIATTVISSLYNRYSISIAASLPRYRRIEKISDYFVSDTPTWIGWTGDNVFNLTDPSLVFDSYGMERSSYYFIAGDLINLKANKTTPSVNILYYQTPDMSASGLTTYSDWMASRFPHVIIAGTVFELFRMLGKTSEMNTYMSIQMEARMDITKSEIGDSQ